VHLASSLKLKLYIKVKMSDEPRFGTDTDALVNVMRSGVQYTGKISQIFSQLHTSDEGFII
jgi:hypothetical protein